MPRSNHASSSQPFTPQGKALLQSPLCPRDHTERLLPAFGASFRTEKKSIILHGPQRLEATELDVPGDFSSAAFWMVLAAGLPGAKLTLRKVGLNPTRTALISALLRMGAGIMEKVEQPTPEPLGTITVTGGGRLKATQVSGKEIPNLIDEIPILAVAAALAEGTTEIKDRGELRHKESDRLAVITKIFAFSASPWKKSPMAF